MATLAVGGFTFGPYTASVYIPNIIPNALPSDTPAVYPTNWSLIIAITIGCLLILTALIIAYRIRRKEMVYQGAAEMTSDYRFHGKLSVYAIIVDDGKREIRPFDFRLHTIEEKKITLRNIFDSAGEKKVYTGAEGIQFIVGPEESIIIRNRAKATIKVMGRNYEYQSKVQLFYDQKCYIVFDKDENELEISYRRAKEEYPNAARMIPNVYSRLVDL
jgi:hypothetical protein